ncbi:MAG: hypothetical protein COB07_02440 [Sulfurovum sp.]|nr:MAG: hypothetical protein COB07_07205 [Sulfurovum sp.]PHS41349.1 MAG: hypothetical protein COB07_02440 [Sulfurovum sp.]
MLFGYNRHIDYTKRDCVQKISAFLLLLLLIGLSGCEEKTADDAPMPVENTTEVSPQKETDPQEETESSKQKISEIETGANTFILRDTKAFPYKVTISNEKVIFHENAKPIVLINLFATWCPPCVGQLSHLNDLQKKHEKELFIVGILTHDAMDESLLKTFLAKNNLHYFISNSPYNDAFATLLANTLQEPENFDIPLTAIYVNGQYFTHYEGVVPVEMIEYDLEQAKKQL